MTLDQICLDYAASSPDEVCGLIIDDARLFPCRNIHPQPHEHFRIDPDDWLAAEDEGEITAVFHSHVDPMPVLSPADRAAQVMTGLPWWLACDGLLRKFRPVPHLLGRKFTHGELDCLSLFRDAYHLAGIDFPDFERTNGWWLRGENLYLKNLEPTGFYQVDHASAQPGDVLILKPFAGADPCHAMVLLDDGVVLHHSQAEYASRREPYRLAFVKQTHSIWRHQQCSNFDSRGIYADFSARSH
ncbi:C40 family peptidase [Escherichia coli]|nr:C40 family peptidase [Escherichia coli]